MAHKNKTNLSPYKTRKLSKIGKQKPEDLGQKLPSHLAPRGEHRKPTQVFDEQQANDRFYDLFRNHDFGHITHPQRMLVAKFYVELMKVQEKENFTRLLTLKDIGIKHFVDCMILPKLTELKFPLIDVGTGPGFPGIPLKFLYPNETIILAEGVQRRVEFLKTVRDELKLKNLPIIGRNINEYFAYPVNGVITRAVEDVGNTLRNTMTCLQTNGRVYFMKGPNVDPEIEIALKELGHIYKLVEDHHYLLPKTDQKRRLVVFEKYVQTELPDFDEEPWPEGD